MIDTGYIKSRFWIHLKNLMLDTGRWILAFSNTCHFDQREKSDCMHSHKHKISPSGRNDNPVIKTSRHSLLDPVYFFMKKFFPVSRNQYPVSVHFLWPVFFIVFINLAVFINVESHALESDFEGQLSGWLIESEINDHWEESAGIRYIPDLDISHQLDNDTAIDSEISLNMFSSAGEGGNKYCN